MSTDVFFFLFLSFIFFCASCSIRWGVWVFDNIPSSQLLIFVLTTKQILISISLTQKIVNFLGRMFKIATYYETLAVFEYDSYLILMIAQKQLKGGIMC